MCSPNMAVDREQGGISAVHSDIIQTNIFNRLDGQTLASVSCASTQLHALSKEDKLWKDISTATWPSIHSPRVQDVISTFRSGHRSFFSDSFPLLTHLSNSKPQNNLRRPGLISNAISAVDIYYKNEVIFSKVREIDTSTSSTSWFRGTPFRVDLLDPKESLSTSIKIQASGSRGIAYDTILSHLDEYLTLSWIVIDPTLKRTANLSSLRPVSVQRQWFTGDIQVRYGTVLAVEDSSSKFVYCGVVVTCGGKEGGDVHVKEVSLQVEDMDGRVLNGEDSLVILQGAVESEKRKKNSAKIGEERERYVEYVKMKIERRERRQRRERMADMVCVTFGVAIFVAFWSLIWFRR